MTANEKPKVILYWLEKSRAQGILWLLDELKIDYEVQVFRREPTMFAPADLKKIHPLGKSPLLSITPAGASEPIILAESGNIVQYLCDHFGQDTTMKPKRYREGQEGKVGGETEEFLRWQYFLHFNEGTYMATLVQTMLINALKSSQIPFFIRPVTSMVARQMFSIAILPNIKAQLGLLEERLKTSGGDYLCGSNLTAVDVLLCFGLINARNAFGTMGDFGGEPSSLYPKLHEYIARLEAHPGWKRSIDKISEIDSGAGIYFAAPS
ncbi:glutathione S-transferase [Microdochium trichocladiopsis]|uniref:Glutathione S-transferase n=1 Tax=Microdochium trichocladiopsis TaxID=1682393 RepID=A0A9P8YK12_9PEZI|nr:glutathione S-transferase [Microdochium trichocladiopsis]KAH7041313.1 glutathione S-transferase [Microdochium trichocladiopsis]